MSAKTTAVGPSLKTDEDNSDGNAELRSLATGGTFSLIGIVMNSLLGFAMLDFISRAVGQARAGLVFEVMAIASMAGTVALLGADIGLIKMLPATRRAGTRSLTRLFVVSVVPVAVLAVCIGLAIMFTAPTIERALAAGQLATGPKNVSLAEMVWIIPAIAVGQAVFAAVRVWSVTAAIATQYIALPALRLGGVLLAISAGASVANITILWGLPAAAGCLVVAGMIAIYVAKTPKTPMPSRQQSSGAVASARAFWRFAAPRSVENSLLVFISGIDVVLVGVLANSRSAAAYMVAGRYVFIGNVGLQAILLPIQAQFSKCIAEERWSTVKQLYTVATWWSVGVCWPILLTEIVVAPSLMHVFGNGYGVGTTALIIMSIGAMANAATGPIGAVLLMSGYSMVTMVCTLLTVLVNVVGNVILIPHMGATGAALAWCACVVANNGLLCFALHRLRGLHILNRRTLAMAGLCLGCFALPTTLLHLIGVHWLVGEALAIAVGTVFYAAVIIKWRSWISLDTLVVGLVRRFSA